MNLKGLQQVLQWPPSKGCHCNQCPSPWLRVPGSSLVEDGYCRSVGVIPWLYGRGVPGILANISETSNSNCWDVHPWGIMGYDRDAHFYFSIYFLLAVRGYTLMLAKSLVTCLPQFRPIVQGYCTSIIHQEVVIRFQQVRSSNDRNT